MSPHTRLILRMLVHNTHDKFINLVLDLDIADIHRVNKDARQLSRKR